jgi:nucleotide-binding universal stress UspA family protein
VKILLAYDGHAQAALEEVARLARESPGAEVVVLGVVAPSAAQSRFATGPPPHVRDDVMAAHAELQKSGIEAEMKVEAGDPAEVILHEARERGVDLIVTGTRGRGPVARALLGSVSHRVTEEAACDVLVVGEAHRVKVERREEPPA